ncbi:MAG: adenylylsulfate kinase [Cryomorphaceae bacterium BACL7 MAG-120322-bin74]|jgi:adenylyl-sulfate kinase|nr:MAG: adenylylsulfate kinase [Cryomorphaceae bacterium BACL7 MAG-120322-bin74]KRO83273.1 MAG: adenylylsulfate kinase [Cryomorphaceae bacterium BACL7 MAG-121220-bin83]
MKSSEHVVIQDYRIQPEDREKALGQRGQVLWFTGLSGSGKSTLANEVETALHRQGKHTFLLDGDNLRHGLNGDLGFSEAARTENIRRVAEVANLMANAGLIVLTAFVSPFEADRKKARDIIGVPRFIEIFVDCPLAVCESRDVKGLYAKARQGLIPDFTGISSPFEAPTHPTLHVHTYQMDLAACRNLILDHLA